MPSKWKLLSHVWLFEIPWTLCPWKSSGNNTGVSHHPFLLGVFLTQGSNLGLLQCRQILNHWASREAVCVCVCVCVCVHVLSHVQLFVTHKPPLSMGFSWQQYWSGLPFPFPHWHSSKESPCNAGDPGSIPGSERYPGEGNGYPLQYSCQ